MATKTFLSHSSEETIAQGQSLAQGLRPPALILLSGELGAGKTTLTKGIISGLNAAREEEVTSPTFTLVHTFRGNCTVYHVDLYRVEGFHDLETLGLEDMFAEEAIVIVEWPERLTLRTDWPVLQVRLDHIDHERRQITVEEGDVTATPAPEKV